MMQRMLARRVRPGAQDAGLAVVTVIMVGAILTAMGVALTRTAIVNLDNAGRDRVGTSALGAAEAGVSQGISFIRQNGTGQICTGCTAAYNVGQEQTITFTNGSKAKVSINEISAYLPPVNKVGRYLIKSIGTSGLGPGKRTIEQTVEVKPLNFPLGIYTQAKINLGGNVSVTQESVFSGSCVDSRDKLTFLAGAGGSVLDPYNGIPAAVHSTSYITNANQSACSVADVTTLKTGDTRLEHRTSTCNSTWPGDQDNDVRDGFNNQLGGPFPAGDAGAACRTATSDANGTPLGDYGAKGSGFNLDVMKNSYGYVEKGLTDEQYALLKARAQAAGTYFPAGVSPTFPVASTVPGNPGYNPVIYIENQNLSLTSQLSGYAWQADVLPCNLKHPSIVIIIRNGSLNLGSSTSFTGNLFVPEGEIAFAGSSQLVGTMFSKDLKFVGGGNVGLNDCFAKNTNGNILSVVRTKFREVDS